jgi:hypothetical protein
MDISSDNFKPTNIYDFMTKTDEQIVDQLNDNHDRDNLINSQDRESHADLKDESSSDRKRTLYQRLFSKMEAGSLRGSVFAMSSLALGTGCLALPQKFEQMSLLAALIVIILGSFAAYWSLTLMIKASNKTKTYDYSRLVKEELGKGPSLMLDIVILIYIIGILISYQCISNILFN